MKNQNTNKYSTTLSFKIDAKEKDYLYVQESQIFGSGKGLYTAIPIYKDEVISLFKGEILELPEAQMRSEKRLDAYFINLPDGKIMDSMNVNCFAKYANDARGFVKTKFNVGFMICVYVQDKYFCIAKYSLEKVVSFISLN